MFKKYASIVIFIWVSVACSSKGNEEAKECPPQMGFLKIAIDETISVDARFITFKNTTGNMAVIRSSLIGGECVQVGSLIINIEKKIGIQDLIADTPDLIQVAGETFFLDYDDDLILAEFDLDEQENNSIEITTMNESTIEGFITATYIQKVGAVNFSKFPSTISFNNAPFKAEFFE